MLTTFLIKLQEVLGNLLLNIVILLSWMVKQMFLFRRQWPGFMWVKADKKVGIILGYLYLTAIIAAVYTNNFIIWGFSTSGFFFLILIQATRDTLQEPTKEELDLLGDQANEWAKRLMISPTIDDEFSDYYSSMASKYKNKFKEMLEAKLKLNGYVLKELHIRLIDSTLTFKYNIKAKICKQ